MNWIETLIIVCGLSMDVFASVECQGAMLAKIRTKQLVLVTLLVSVWQVIVLYLGNLGADLLCKYDIKESQVILGEVISVAVFLCLGIRLLIKAWKNDRIDERREENLGVHKFVRICAVTSFYTFLTGAAFGFLGTSLLSLILVGIILTVVCVVGGAYVGYHFGYEQKTKVYLIGGILLLIGGADGGSRHSPHRIGGNRLWKAGYEGASEGEDSGRTPFQRSYVRISKERIL